MRTPWGKGLRKDKVLKEYPRPQFKRDSYINLNGEWDYAILPIKNKDDLFSTENLGVLPLSDDRINGKIIVPFSPESELSRVKKRIKTNEILVYQRKFYLTKSFNKGKMMLHFEAIDSVCAIYINGIKIREHEGGYWPIDIDVTRILSAETTITVCVYDAQDEGDLARGKQRIKNGSIWYTAQTGIWQTVWLETMPKVHIENLKITPMYDYSYVEICINVTKVTREICKIYIGDDLYCTDISKPCRIPLENFIPWTPENPHLYRIKIRYCDDVIESYFAMRKISVDTDKKGIKRLFLNNKPYFHHGVLDQGYWSDGLMTAPTDAAMIHDIQTMKDMGFNMLRKHIKIEPLRWYYHCDRLGMLVWQDMVCGGSNIQTPEFTGEYVSDGAENYERFGRNSKESRDRYYKEVEDTIDLLYNCPCIVMWVAFNEGWGQFDAFEAARRIKQLDPTRLIDHASGWHDQNGGDVNSVHVYFAPYKYTQDHENRATVLSEFGGYNLEIPEHTFKGKVFGYRAMKSQEDLEEQLKQLYMKEIVPAKRKGLAASVYTQLSDVEVELNGLLTYDRHVTKVRPEVMREISKRLIDEQ